MLASQLIQQLQDLVAKEGDYPVSVWDGCDPLDQVEAESLEFMDGRLRPIWSHHGVRIDNHFFLS